MVLFFVRTLIGCLCYYVGFQLLHMSALEELMVASLFVAGTMISYGGRD
jgi:hypothetical protein